jgi:hypothetical protein
MTNPAIGLTTSQQRALADMGIDLWVRRTGQRRANVEEAWASAVGPTSAELVRAADIEVRAANRSSNDAASVSRTDEDAAYRAELDCLATQGVVIVGRWQNALDKRLANDIAMAIAMAHDQMMVQSPKLQQAAFKWPATQTGDRSFRAARSAFKAFLRGQAERAHARCVVLFGDAAGALADDQASATARVVRQPSIGALRADPSAKKALWLNVSQNVPD